MNDEATVEKLVNENIALAYFFAERYFNRLEKWVDHDEIISNALLGLFDAAKEFDASLGFKFSTFARIHIRKRILRPIRDIDTLRRGGTDRVFLHLDEVGEDGEPIWHDRIADTSVEEVSDKYYCESANNVLSRALPQLNSQYRLIVMFRFGLGGLPQKTLEEIGEHFGVTRERIRQIERDAIVALRKIVAEQMATIKEVTE